MKGVLLDPITGLATEETPELMGPDGVAVRIREMMDQGWTVPREYGEPLKLPYDRLPDSVADFLERGRHEQARHRQGKLLGVYTPPHMNTRLGFQEVLYSPIADGTAVTAAAETIMVPNYTLPANMLLPGSTLRYTLFFRVSTAITTPGTITQRLRYGGVAGTVLAASGAWAPDATAAATNLTGRTCYLLVCRSAGPAGTIMCCGDTFVNDVDDASAAAIVANMAMTVIPVSAPATAAVDTTAASALSPTWTQTVATGSMTAHLAVLESMN